MEVFFFLSSGSLGLVYQVVIDYLLALDRDWLLLMSERGLLMRGITLIRVFLAVALYDGAWFIFV